MVECHYRVVVECYDRLLDGANARDQRSFKRLVRDHQGFEFPDVGADFL